MVLRKKIRGNSDDRINPRPLTSAYPSGHFPASQPLEFLEGALIHFDSHTPWLKAHCPSNRIYQSARQTWSYQLRSRCNQLRAVELGSQPGVAKGLPRQQVPSINLLFPTVKAFVILEGQQPSQLTVLTYSNLFDKDSQGDFPRCQHSTSAYHQHCHVDHQ